MELQATYTQPQAFPLAGKRLQFSETLIPEVPEHRCVYCAYKEL